VSRGDDPRLDQTPLKPANAVAAIITVDGSYLLQLRDNRHGIFFPAHWGCFGGATEPGETREDALTRELHEELGVTLAPAAFRYFTRFDFDLSFAGLAPIWRFFYETEMEPERLSDLQLQEGAAMRLFSAEELLTGTVPVTPYDSFALWFHVNRRRLRA